MAHVTKSLAILIGDSQDILIELVTELIQEVVGDGYELTVYASDRANELRELAETFPIDLFVPFLNNILFSDGDKALEVSMEKVMQLVSEMKEKYGKPIIALSGMLDWDKQSKLAGVDYFFTAPFPPEEFMVAVKTVLFGKRKLSEIEAAGEFVLMVTKGVQQEWPEIANELNAILQVNYSISDDDHSGFEFVLAVIASQIQALPNLLPADQASRILEYVMLCVSTPELGNYPREMIQEYQTAWEQSLEEAEPPIYGIASILYDQLECQDTVEVDGARLKNPLLLMALSEKIVTFGGPWWKTISEEYDLIQ